MTFIQANITLSTLPDFNHENAEVGQRIKLSAPDILQAKKLYRCPG